MPEKMDKEIKLEEGHGKKFKNKYGYDLVILNGNIKGKKGYFVKLDDKIYGPFMKILMQKTGVDEDRFMICMSNAIESHIVRIGINGFEVVEKLNFSNELESAMLRKDMSKGIDGVKKIGTRDRYAVYATADNKVFVELKGVSLDDLSKYQMFDSYKELYLYHKLNNNDNSFFDTGSRFLAYSPDIFNKICRFFRTNRPLDLEEDGIHLKGTREINIISLKIIEALKSRYSMEQLYTFTNSMCTKRGMIKPADLENIINKCSKFYSSSSKFHIYFKSDDAERYIKDTSAKLYGDVVFIRLDENNVWIYENDKLRRCKEKYLNLEEALLYIKDKLNKKCVHIEKKCDNIEESLTTDELSMIDFCCLKGFTSYSALKGVNWDMYISFAQHMSIEQLKEEMKNIIISQKVDNYRKQEFFDEWYRALYSKTEFKNAVKYFVQMMELKYPVEFQLFLERRNNTFSTIFCNRDMTLMEKMDCLFAGKTQKDLNQILREIDKERKIVKSKDKERTKEATINSDDNTDNCDSDSRVKH